MRTIAAFALLTLASISLLSATSVPPVPLEELVRRAENIWGGKVVAVRMEDEKGNAITDLEARTGPGIKNTIYLDVVVDQTRILKSSRSKISEKISIPLWQMWHYTLGQIKELEGSESIFLLSADLQPAHVTSFQRSLDEEAEIKRLIKQSSPGNREKPAKP